MDEDLSPYEKQRLERIAQNNAFLASLGLEAHKPKAPARAPAAPRVPRARRPRAPSRRSERVAGGATAAARYEPEEFRLSRPARANDDEDDDDDDDDGEDDAAPRRYRSALPALTPAQQAQLDSTEGAWLGRFEHFINREIVPAMSDTNIKRTMVSVRKLASGAGVNYDSAQYGWPEDAFLRKDAPVTLGSDLAQLFNDAREMERVHGRDHTNGWLLTHPSACALSLSSLVSRPLSLSRLGRPRLRERARASPFPRPRRRQSRSCYFSNNSC